MRRSKRTHARSGAHALAPAHTHTRACNGARERPGALTLRFADTRTRTHPHTHAHARTHTHTHSRTAASSAASRPSPAPSVSPPARTELASPPWCLPVCLPFDFAGCSHGVERAAMGHVRMVSLALHLCMEQVRARVRARACACGCLRRSGIATDVSGDRSVWERSKREWGLSGRGP
jgi:hypothetical protein